MSASRSDWAEWLVIATGGAAFAVYGALMFILSGSGWMLASALAGPWLSLLGMAGMQMQDNPLWEDDE